jgi:hypothetical protein
MANLTSITINGGVPNSGTGTVSTIDGLMADGGQATLGSKADAASTATNATPTSVVSILKELSACLQTLSAAVVSLGQATMAGSAPVVIASDQSGAGFDYVPKTVTAMITASSGNVANGACVVQLGGSAGKRTFLTGFQATASGATAANVVTLTIVGVAGGLGTLYYSFTFPAGVGLSAEPLNIIFDPPLVSATVAGPFIATLPAGGSGNLNACVNLTGFIQ